MRVSQTLGLRDKHLFSTICKCSPGHVRIDCPDEGPLAGQPTSTSDNGPWNGSSSGSERFYSDLGQSEIHF